MKSNRPTRDAGTASRAEIIRLRQEREDLKRALQARSDPLVALKAVKSLPGNPGLLVERLIRAVYDLDEMADPRRGQNLEAQRSYRRADSTVDEGASTRWARDLYRRLENRVLPVLSEFDDRVAGKWEPAGEERIPRVRCRVSQCPAVDVTVPAWRVLRGGRVLYAERCQSCGTMLATVDEKPSTVGIT